MQLTDKVCGAIKGIGAKKEAALSSLGISTVQDLLLHFPFRYEDLANKPISELLDGEKTTIKGLVLSDPVIVHYGKSRTKLTFRILVEGQNIPVHFFNQPYLKTKVAQGSEMALFGKWDGGRKSLTGMKILATQAEAERFEPVYHTNKSVRQSDLIKWIKSAFDLGYGEQFEENLPERLRQKYRLLAKVDAVRALHFPKDSQEHHEAVRRVKFEELFSFQMKIAALRHKEKVLSTGRIVDYDIRQVKAFIQTLPFDLTQAQKRVTNEIMRDLKSATHMLRLLQGDVGSGKTVIAAIAMFAVKSAEKQSALMVPTEILAMQHEESLRFIFGKTGVRVALLTSSTKSKERERILEKLKNGEIDVLVGTHALIQKGVDFHDLALVITDEQHRFGVNQRKVLREKGENPDVLFMTATPIPRTLAITAYGEMDVCVLDELPAGRIPIETRWIQHKQIPQLLTWLENELQKGHQVYFISPLIEESEAMDLQNATQLATELTDYFQERHSVALLHGKMKNEEKEQIMEQFKEKKIAILVSTTVVEVGVNIPNATVMTIMDADRFGLAQLHQLRGRVGRSDKKSYCILVANPKSENGKKRMKIMTQTNNGFVLSEKDLELRGAGEIFGTRQSGLPNFAVANIVEDFSILEIARQEATQIWHTENWQELPENKMLLAYYEEAIKCNAFD